MEHDEWASRFIYQFEHGDWSFPAGLHAKTKRYGLKGLRLFTVCLRSRQNPSGREVPLHPSAQLSYLDLQLKFNTLIFLPSLRLVRFFQHYVLNRFPTSTSFQIFNPVVLLWSRRRAVIHWLGCVSRVYVSLLWNCGGKCGNSISNDLPHELNVVI